MASSLKDDANQNDDDEEVHARGVTQQHWLSCLGDSPPVTASTTVSIVITMMMVVMMMVVMIVMLMMMMMVVMVMMVVVMVMVIAGTDCWCCIFICVLPPIICFAVNYSHLSHTLVIIIITTNDNEV